MTANPYSGPISSSEPAASGRSKVEFFEGVSRIHWIVWLVAITAFPAMMIFEEYMIASHDSKFRLGYETRLGPLVAVIVPFFTKTSFLRKLTYFALTLFAILATTCVAGAFCFSVLGFSAT